MGWRKRARRQGAAPKLKVRQVDPTPPARRTRSTKATAPHVWLPQVPGDSSRHGCVVCGGESHRVGVTVYRMPDERAFSATEPVCIPARGRRLDANPENARRALRVAALHHGIDSRDVPTGYRCAGCGYGPSSAPEGHRQAIDFWALEAELRAEFTGPT